MSHAIHSHTWHGSLVWSSKTTRDVDFKQAPARYQPYTSIDAQRNVARPARHSELADCLNARVRRGRGPQAELDICFVEFGQFGAEAANNCQMSSS